MERGAESPEVLAIAGDSSPSSAESSFRELDDVFLQTQTRIWLGEVLQTRLNEHLNVSDLLSDGELLFEVSRVVWKMLLTRRMELRHLKAYKYEPFASKKSSGRYMPYSNVDSFLKICKILGLAGIDLFSPSDVVEKKDSRKVCMCIRSLSKKARSKHLNVPDFDIVTYTVAMPTNMVGCIRRRLELSQRSFTSSASCNSYRDSRRNYRKKNSVAAFAVNYDSCSEESDDAEDNFIIQSESSSTHCSCNTSSQMNSDLINSPGASSLVNNYTPKQKSLQVDVQNRGNYEHTHCQFKKPCVNKSVGSLCSQYVEHDCQLDSMLSSSSVDSQIHLSGRVSNIKSRFRYSCESVALDFDNVDFDLSNDASVMGDFTAGNTNERSCTANWSVISNLIFHGTDTSDPVLFDGEDRIFSAHASTSSHRSNSTSRTFENRSRSKPSDVDDAEVSSTASMNSVSGAVLNLDFDDQFDVEDDIKTVQFLELQDQTTCSVLSQVDSNALKNLHGNQCEELLLGESYSPFDFHQWDPKGKCAVPTVSNKNDGHGVSSQSDSQESLLEKILHCIPTKAIGDASRLKDMKFVVVEDDKKLHGATTVTSDSIGKKQQHHCLSTTYFNNIIDITFDETNASRNILAVEGIENGKLRSTYGGGFQHRDIMIQDNSSQGRHMTDVVTVNNPSIHPNVVIAPNSSEPICRDHSCSLMGKNSRHVCTDHSNNLYCAENMDKLHSMDDRKRKKVDILAIEDSGGTDDPSAAEIEKSKPHRRPLLKSVVKGTAVLGVLFFVLQFRKSGKEKASESNIQYNQIGKGLAVRSSQCERGKRVVD